MRTQTGLIERVLPSTAGEPADVMVIDVGLPCMSGIRDSVRERRPNILMLVVTLCDADEQILRAMCCSRDAFKKIPLSRLLESIRRMADGRLSMSREIAHRVIRHLDDTRPAGRAGDELTPHEVRLLKLLAGGHSYKTAAAELGVTAHTVDFHIRRIYEKLEVHSKSEAVSKALRNGLVE